MKHLVNLIAWTGLLLGSSIATMGCGRAPAEAPKPPPLAVTVSNPIEREVNDYVDLTGRTSAVESVEVRARVWGYLQKVNFKEGTIVNKGDVLFEIDPRTYEAALAGAEGQFASVQAKLTRLNADQARVEKLMKKNAISQEEYDKTIGERAEAAASLESAKAAVQQAKLDMEYTKVVAPISGRVSRKFVTEGNLIIAGPTGGTVLTNIVSVDPIYVYIDVDEHTVQYVRKLIREGKAKSARDRDLPVTMGLANDAGLPHKGIVNFVDNQVNPKTGTLRIRGVFDNPDETLSPGYFARVRVPIGFPHPALLINERAIDTDQGQKIVYVVDKDNKVLSRPVHPGALHDGLRVIDEGLASSDQVIITGLQLVRPGMIVEPKVVEMPGRAACLRASKGDGHEIPLIEAIGGQS